MNDSDRPTNEDDALLNRTPESMLALAAAGGGGSMALWSDDKRSDFVNLFKSRSRAGQYILLATAQTIANQAQQKHFIGIQTRDSLNTQFHVPNDPGDYYKVGGRLTSELNQIAAQRAELILNELPPIKMAVQIIDPDTALKMHNREELLEKMKELKAQIEELPTNISMAELDQDMTIGAFRTMVKDLEKKRKALVEKMCEHGKEGQELDEIINKRLYKGLPGLSEAVVSVVNQYIDRAKALDATTRRVEERVRFGDSAGAVELLQGFERDEVTVSDNVKAEFQAALEKLTLSRGHQKLEAKKRRSKK